MISTAKRVQALFGHAVPALEDPSVRRNGTALLGHLLQLHHGPEGAVRPFTFNPDRTGVDALAIPAGTAHQAAKSVAGAGQQTPAPWRLALAQVKMTARRPWATLSRVVGSRALLLPLRLGELTT